MRNNIFQKILERASITKKDEQNTPYVCGVTKILLTQVKLCGIMDAIFHLEQRDALSKVNISSMTRNYSLTCNEKMKEVMGAC